jgi:hypothetical protein
VAEHSRQEREPVGSVAEETARLVEALGGWAEDLRAQHSAAPADPDPPADAEAAPGHSAGGADSADSADTADPAGGSTARCQHCGTSSRAGEALACRLCPVCQGIALLRTVRPETVERLADVAAALSGALRDIAAERFGQPPPTPQPPPPRGQRVQDIVVDDEDDDDQGAPPRSTAPTPASRTRQESTAP